MADKDYHFRHRWRQPGLPLPGLPLPAYSASANVLYAARALDTSAKSSMTGVERPGLGSVFPDGTRPDMHSPETLVRFCGNGALSGIGLGVLRVGKGVAAVCLAPVEYTSTLRAHRTSSVTALHWRRA